MNTNSMQNVKKWLQIIVYMYKSIHIQMQDYEQICSC